MATAATAARRVAWHGAFFAHHSLASVNRRIAGAIADVSAYSVALTPVGDATFAPGLAGDETAGLLAAAARSATTSSRAVPDADIHVTHHWPPALAPPGTGRWVAFQPWEFGSMPTAWLRPFRDVADDVWVYSTRNRADYLADGLDPARVAVIPLGVDLAHFTPAAPPLARIVAAATKSVKFLFVGGTIRRKGIDILLEAWRRAFTRDDDVCLIIKDFCRNGAYAGQTQDDAISRVANDPAAGAVIHLTDDLPLADLPGLYTACDVLVHPYRGEGFALPVAEALACGRATIVTRGGSTDDFCLPTTSMFIPATRRAVNSADDLVRAGSMLEPQVDQLVALLRLVRSHVDRVRAMGATARLHAEQTLGWARTVAAVRERISLVLARPSRRSCVEAARISSPVAGSSGGRC